MGPQLFGPEHILYILITTGIAAAGLLLSRRYAVTEHRQRIVLHVP